MAVGYLMRTVEGIYLERIALLISAIGAVLGCGLLLALWLQHRLRRTLLDLEPETIVNRFAQQAGVAIVFQSHELEGLKGPGLKGNYGIQDGFDRLLEGSGYRRHGRILH